ncbi:MAG: hypothetical protein ACMUIG_08035 [Thermoplasmatota archaeon]
MNKIVLVSFDKGSDVVADHMIPLLAGSSHPIIIKRAEDPDSVDWIEGNDEIIERYRHPDLEKMSDISSLTGPDDGERGDGGRFKDKANLGNQSGSVLSPHSVTVRDYDLVQRLLEGINPGDMVISIIDIGSVDRILPARYFSGEVLNLGGSSFCIALNRGRFKSIRDLELMNKEYLDLGLQFNGVIALPPKVIKQHRYMDIANIVRHLAKMMFAPGVVNLDHADLLITSRGGTVLTMTWGVAQPGGNGAATSVNDALTNPLCQVDLATVRKALVNVVGGANLSLEDSLVAAEVLKRRIREDARIIWGVTLIDENEEDMEVFLILATTPLELLLHWYSGR